MDRYDLVLAIWVIALALAIHGMVSHFWIWRREVAVRYYLLNGRIPPNVSMSSMIGVRVREAVFQCGLRVLLTVMAMVRVSLQIETPPAQGGAFAASGLQIALAIVFLLILLWCTRWTIAIKYSIDRIARGRIEV